MLWVRTKSDENVAKYNMSNKDLVDIGDEFLLDLGPESRFFDSPAFEVVDRRVRSDIDYAELTIEEMSDSEDRAIFDVAERPFVEALTTPLEERYKGERPAPARSKYGKVFLPDEFEELPYAFEFDNPFDNDKIKAQEFHEQRSIEAQQSDESKQAEETTDLDEWLSNPRRFDFRGVDTPK